MRPPLPPRLLPTLFACAALAGGPAPAMAAPRAAPPAPVEGVVTQVIDGDSLLLQPAGQAPVEVRLRDIDAPEICQAWGPQAKQALQEMALGKSATLHARGRDSYGRTVGSITIEGADLGRRMVEEGHAWSVRTRWDRGPLVKQERQALALRRGLHAATGAVPPKDFRREHGPCTPR